MKSRWGQILCLGTGVLIAMSLAAYSIWSRDVRVHAGQETAPVVRWEYRYTEVAPGGVPAALDELGRDGWEVIAVERAYELESTGSRTRLKPDTFYLFAKRPAK
jgi:hypothetical protein